MNGQQGKPMSYTEAALKVLKDFAEKKPMHYQEIVNIAVSKGWLAPQGLTPGATLTASIGEDNRKREARGLVPRFSVEGKGYYALSEWSQDETTLASIQIAQKIEDEIISYLQKVSPSKFEEVIAVLLDKMGFVDVQRVGKSGDGGIDVEAKLEVLNFARFTAIIQVKRYTGSIGPKFVRELRGTGLKTGGMVELRILITTSNFTGGAKEESQMHPAIRLVDGAELAQLMIEHEVGVSKQQVTTHTIIKGFFEPPVINVQAANTPEPVQEVPENTESNDGNIKVPTNKVILPEGLLLSARFKDGRVVEAIVRKNNHVEYDGNVYVSIHAAGATAAGWKSCNGWTFWQYQDPETGEWTLLDALRQK